jgi:hypothetical protein
MGRRIAAKALAFATADDRIPFVTFLLPPSRRHLSALARLGAGPVDRVEHDGATFLTFQSETGSPRNSA